MASEKYELGYLNTILQALDMQSISSIKAISQQCRRLVIGIPSNYVMARLYGEGRNGYDAQTVHDIWKEFRFIDDVIILDDHSFGYQEMYERLHFDACFYGSEYGRAFEQDKAFFAEKGVAFLPLLPERAMIAPPIDFLSLSLRGLQKDKKLILFGSGKYFDLFRKYYKELHPVSYAVDSSSEFWNMEKDSIPIKSPDELKNEAPENCLVILCGKDYDSMKDKLLSYGNFDYRTLRFNNQISLIEAMYLVLAAENQYLSIAHSTLLKLLAEFDRICMKYQLKYFIICGSLIGAIRHKGFIPWDDDLDLAMPREDYEKLRKICEEEWKNSEYHVLHYDSIGKDVFLDFMPRVIYLKGSFPTKVFDKAAGRINPEYDKKVFLDIYPLDNASENNFKHNLTMLKMKFVYNLCMGHRGVLDYSEYERLPKWKVNVMKLVHGIGKLIPFKFLIRRYEKLSRYAEHEQSNYYFMPSCAITCIERRFEKKSFESMARVPFENIECSIPVDHDTILHEMGYHGYMNFPPLSIRKPSHYFNSDITIW